MRYFKVDDRTEDYFEPLAPRGENIKRPGGCGSCGTVPRDGVPPPVCKVRSLSSRSVVSHTSWGFGVIAIEILESIGVVAAHGLTLGKLAGPDGAISDRFRTFLGCERIVLRGDARSEHYVCEICGAMVYTYLPRNAPYVTAQQVNSSRHVYEVESMGLLVSESIRVNIGDRWSQVLAFHEIPVLERPRDGLPPEMNLWPDESLLVGYQPNPSKLRRS